MPLARLLALLLPVLSVLAVDVPATVTHVTDGDTIAATLADGSAVKVRLLYVDTPESKGNAHGEATPEGKAAAAFLASLLPVGAAVTLWGPDKDLEHDRYNRVLAVIWKHEAMAIGAGNNQGADTPVQVNINLAIVRAGWSPYWRKYGKAPGNLDAAYADAQEQARTANAGAWATAPKYMTDKANETTAPKPKD